MRITSFIVVSLGVFWVHLIFYSRERGKMSLSGVRVYYFQKFQNRLTFSRDPTDFWKEPMSHLKKAARHFETSRGLERSEQPDQHKTLLREGNNKIERAGG
jgi:hypothetical protein